MGAPHESLVAECSRETRMSNTAVAGLLLPRKMWQGATPQAGQGKGTQCNDLYSWSVHSCRLEADQARVQGGGDKSEESLEMPFCWLPLSFSETGRETCCE